MTNPIRWLRELRSEVQSVLSLLPSRVLTDAAREFAASSRELTDLLKEVRAHSFPIKPEVITDAALANALYLQGRRLLAFAVRRTDLAYVEPRHSFLFDPLNSGPLPNPHQADAQFKQLLAAAVLAASRDANYHSTGTYMFHVPLSEQVAAEAVNA